jgi:2-polyprenyl-6-hydroxyphenyl methylase/3-demethylubiquinone-9 3-methyltransferase
MATRVADVRFTFGKNWEKFLQLLNEFRIAQAIKSLQTLLGTESLEGKSFLDVGSGSGLFSLAALRLGAASVHSFDYDLDSVSCAQYLKQRFFPNEGSWTIERGDILDEAFLEALGAFDVVYSWGVLHHTGQMWRALDNISRLVQPGGQLIIALYNDQGWISQYWTRVKRIYNSGVGGRVLISSVFVPYFFFGCLIKDVLQFKNPVKRYRSPSSRRGMSVFYDWIDWLGGYPFEVAKPDAIVDFYKSRNFKCEKTNTVGRKLGCNEFMLRHLANN